MVRRCGKILRWECVVGEHEENLDVLVEQVDRMTHEFTKRPIQMRESLCGTSEPHLGAQIVPPDLAEATRLAVDSDLQGDAIAYLEGAGWGEVGA